LKKSTSDTKASQASIKTQKIVVDKSVMSNEMETAVLKVAAEAYEKHSKKMNMAKHITVELKNRYNGTWQCIIGSFTFQVYHKSNDYIYFHIDKDYFLIFRTE
jgi:hypothetical protein